MRRWHIVSIIVALGLGIAIFSLKLINKTPSDEARKSGVDHDNPDEASKHVARGSNREEILALIHGQSKNSQASLSNPSNQTLPENIQSAINLFKNTSIPLSKRSAEIMDLARRGDDFSVKILMALGNESTFLNWKAMEALGTLSQYLNKDLVIEYLKGKLSNENSRVAQSALKAYGRLAKEDAVNAIASAIKDNRKREDGYERVVNKDAIETLGTIGSKAAIPILKEELFAAIREPVDLEHGTAVVQAISKINTPASRRAIEAYITLLKSKLPKDPMAKKYFLNKIAETKRYAKSIE